MENPDETRRKYSVPNRDVHGKVHLFEFIVRIGDLSLHVKHQGRGGPGKKQRLTVPESTRNGEPWKYSHVSFRRFQRIRRGRSSPCPRHSSRPHLRKIRSPMEEYKLRTKRTQTKSIEAEDTGERERNQGNLESMSLLSFPLWPLCIVTDRRALIFWLNLMFQAF